MLTETSYSQFARDYKRSVAGKYMLVDGANIIDKIGGSDFLATKKYDGIMQVLFLENGKARAFNSGGNPTPEHLPCISDFERATAAAGIAEGIFAAELYATISSDGRERVCDVAQALADDALHCQLRLAVFDIIELDGQPVKTEHYKEKYDRLRSVFGKGELVHTVAGKRLYSKAELVALFNTTVITRGAEGLVVHSESPVVYKVKPRHSIDAVVIGYTSGEDSRREMVRDLLCAVMHPDGTLRQIASVGTGFTDDMRSGLHRRLSGMHVASDYIETDSRGVAFQMVRPEMVVEISAVDYVTENASGDPKQNMLVTFADGHYSPLGKAPGAVLHSPVFLRERPDKTACADDVRLSQLTDLCQFSEGRAKIAGTLPLSTILVRRVFIKHSGLKRMVQKFVVWKTNKEQTGSFPAYVLHHTDYNYSRREQLRRDLRVSASREQIFSLLDEMIEANVRKGWEEKIC